MDINVGGLANTLEAARRANVKRIIFASTSAVYENGTTFPSKETDVLCPTLIYPCSKQQGEILCKSFIHNYNMEIVILRPPLIYGKGVGGYFRIILNLIKLKLPLPLGSFIHNKRSFIYLENLLNLLNILIKHPKAANEIFLSFVNK